MILYTHISYVSNEAKIDAALAVYYNLCLYFELECVKTSQCTIIIILYLWFSFPLPNDIQRSLDTNCSVWSVDVQWVLLISMAEQFPSNSKLLKSQESSFIDTHNKYIVKIMQLRLICVSDLIVHHFIAHYD